MQALLEYSRRIPLGQNRELRYTPGIGLRIIKRDQLLVERLSPIYALDEDSVIAEFVVIPPDMVLATYEKRGKQYAQRILIREDTLTIDTARKILATVS